PTAMADSLTWFDNNGYDVVPTANNGTQTPGGEVNLISALGTAASTNGGTWNDNAVRALRSYLSGPNNNSGHRWDVKFQGTTYFRGYTVGQNAATVSESWFKQELADKEDVMFSIDWYTETAPGVLSARQGAHQITLDGYTAGPNSSLLIRDPAYPEGIIERDTSFPGRLIYEYSTGTANLRAEIVDVISVSPKEHLLIDGIFLPSEYHFPILPTPQFTGGKSVYGDYVSFGIEDHFQTTPFTGKTVSFVDSLTHASFFDVFFDFSGNATVVPQIPTFPSWLTLDDLVEVAVAFDSGSGSYEYEMFLNREAFGLLFADTSVDVLLGGELVTDLELSSQAFSPPNSQPGGTPDLAFPYPETSTDPQVLLDEMFSRQAAIASIPEPTLLTSLFAVTMLITRRVRRD
ncbi:MAG TPA: hypothetical protein PK402_11625, partial [Tepidisphaeraceae bacterium]|nr:hypothetical protein [Tepidisphaeraceae bacterium]